MLSLGLEIEPIPLKDGGHKNCDLMAGGHLFLEDNNPLGLAYSSPKEIVDHTFIPFLLTRITSLVKHFLKKLGLPSPVFSLLQSRLKSD